MSGVMVFFQDSRRKHSGMTSDYTSSNGHTVVKNWSRKSNMLKAFLQIPAHFLFRAFGWPSLPPMSLTLSVTFRCNSRCRTCNVYRRDAAELSQEEWIRVFQSLGTAPVWVTISGGEPFLRSDLYELIVRFYEICRPSIINIPTNGLLSERIPLIVADLAKRCSNAQLVLNVSIDDIRERNDLIRGVPGSYDRATTTFKALKALGLPNLTVGIHTVISRYNVHRIPEIYEHLQGLEPDSYITEIAEERQELGTIGAEITPAPAEYAKAADFLVSRMKESTDYRRVGRLTRAFRIQYYDMVKEVLRDRRQVLPCYAGFASAHIAPDGDVWMCCIKAEPVGNLRDAHFDFLSVWNSKKAQEERKGIKEGRCYCPLANVSYTNMLYDVRRLFRVGCSVAGLR